MIENLRKDVNYIWSKYMTVKLPMILSDNEKKAHTKRTRCHICSKKFPRPLPDGKKSFSSKVRDHCHVSGVYRGAACKGCNIKYQEGKFVPIYFHNLNYDSSCFIKELAKYKEDPLTVLPVNTERYISFSQKMK